MNPGTPEVVARTLSSALEPLADALSAAQAEDLFAALGLRFPPAALTQASVAGPLNVARTAAAALPARRTTLDTAVAGNDATAVVQAGVALLQSVTSLFTALDTLGGAFAAVPPASVPGIDAAALADFSANLRRRLLAHALVVYMRPRVPTFAGALALGGVLENVPSRGDVANPARPAYVRRDLHLERLPDLLTNPTGLLRNLYGWGNATFNAQALLDALAGFLENLGQMARVDSPAPGQFALRSLFVDIVPDTSRTPNGLTGRLHASVGDGVTRTFPLSARWTASVETKGEFAPETALTIAPPATLVLTPPSPNFAGGITATLEWSGTPFVLFGTADQSRLEVGGCSIAAGVTFTPSGATSDAKLDRGRAVIDTSKGDSFLRFLTGGAHAEGSFWLSGGWTPADGLRFGGSGPEIAIPVHTRIGPTEFKTLYLRLGVDSGALAVEMSAALSASLGPLLASVDRLGVIARVSFPSGGGNLGPANLTFDFKPPTGVGLSLDAGGFKGGGFLRFEPEKGEYSGTLELTFAELVSVRAVGILSTRLPDGRDGFSLILIIVSEFVPIQLSYGFTLLGVGGLLGLNRTIELDALQLGVRDGTLNSILFPTDVVANAPRIISDLKRVFPPHEDRFLIGPMGKLGWGTPTLISLEIGLLLELPRPAFAIVGVLRVQLPAEEFGTLYLQVNFAGSVDFEKGQLQFDASLYNSRVLISPLTGDMALRIYWGGDPNFLLTVGGFHPAYTPPPMNIGNLSRLGLVVSPGIPSVRAELYFAVTSNTVQFGARVEVMYGVSFFNIFGFVCLDVLIQFNPFKFIAEITAMFGVRTGSTVLFAIRIAGTLEGPTPWHVRGEASFEIGFIIKIRLSANFDVTSGESRNTLLPAIDVIAAIGHALDNIGNWRAVLPRASNQHVSLRELPQSGAALVLHPFGALEISQKIVPLNIAVQRVGSSRPDRGSIFRLTPTRINNVDVVTTPSTEQFAPAQFFELDDAAKLSRPSFARYDAGIVIGSDDAPQADFRRERDVQYEVIYLPEHHPVRVICKMATTLFQAFARGGSAAQSSLAREARAPSAVAAEPVALAPETYAVVSTMDMTLHAAPMIFASATAADQAVAALIAARPELSGAVQVVPSVHVRQAA
jgi:hypothetical protein